MNEATKGGSYEAMKESTNEETKIGGMKERMKDRYGLQLQSQHKPVRLTLRVCKCSRYPASDSLARYEPTYG